MEVGGFQWQRGHQWQLQAWPVGISTRRPARSCQAIMNGGLGEGMGPEHLAQVQAAACWGVHLGG